MQCDLVQLVGGGALLGSLFYLMRKRTEGPLLQRQDPTILDALSMPIEPMRWWDGLAPDYDDEHEQRQYERPVAAGGPIPVHQYENPDGQPDVAGVKRHIMERSKTYDYESVLHNVPLGADSLYVRADEHKTDYDPLNRDY